MPENEDAIHNQMAGQQMWDSVKQGKNSRCLTVLDEILLRAITLAVEVAGEFDGECPEFHRRTLVNGRYVNVRVWTDSVADPDPLACGGTNSRGNNPRDDGTEGRSRGNSEGI